MLETYDFCGRRYVKEVAEHIGPDGSRSVDTSAPVMRWRAAIAAAEKTRTMYPAHPDTTYYARLAARRLARAADTSIPWQ